MKKLNFLSQETEFPKLMNEDEELKMNLELSWTVKNVRIKTFQIETEF